MEHMMAAHYNVKKITRLFIFPFYPPFLQIVNVDEGAPHYVCVKLSNDAVVPHFRGHLQVVDE